jgi:NAD(P)H-dependent FMN reductase
MKKFVNGLKNGLNKAANAIGGFVRNTVDFVDRHAPKAVAAVVTVGGLIAGAVAHAQTDATVIATNAQTAFGVIAPITITIAGFYVILKIAKRVVH